MMLADSCESTVRARKPAHRAEIADIVQSIFDARMRDGQLDECGLTLRDLAGIKRDLHRHAASCFSIPRINYPSTGGARRPQVAVTQQIPVEVYAPDDPPTSDETPEQAPPKRQTAEVRPVSQPPREDTDEAPLLEVPPLRRTQRINPTEKEPDDEV